MSQILLSEVVSIAGTVVCHLLLLTIGRIVKRRVADRAAAPAEAVEE